MAIAFNRILSTAFPFQKSKLNFKSLSPTLLGCCTLSVLFLESGAVNLFSLRGVGITFVLLIFSEIFNYFNATKNLTHTTFFGLNYSVILPEICVFFLYPSSTTALILTFLFCIKIASESMESHIQNSLTRTELLMALGLKSHSQNNYSLVAMRQLTIATFVTAALVRIKPDWSTYTGLLPFFTFAGSVFSMLASHKDTPAEKDIP